MYIALISAHALGLSGMHLFTCIKAQWNGEHNLSFTFLLQPEEPQSRINQRLSCVAARAQRSSRACTITLKLPFVCSGSRVSLSKVINQRVKILFQRLGFSFFFFGHHDVTARFTREHSSAETEEYSLSWTECSDFSPGVSVLLLIFLCLEAILFLTFTAVMFGTQIHSICNDETVGARRSPTLTLVPLHLLYVSVLEGLSWGPGTWFLRS